MTPELQKKVDFANEEWCDIVGYEGKYQISNMGRVKSLARKIERRGQSPKYVQEKYKSTKMLKGYPCVILCKDGKEQTYSIHRLVAIAFIPNPNNLPHIDHINTMRTDNRIENLRWVDRSMNMMNETTRKKRSEQWRKKTHEGRNAMVERKKRPVEALNDKGVVVFRFDKIALAAKHFGVNHSNICVACRDIQKTCQGYHWRYVSSINPIGL